ncbi:uncharacterized protein LOC114271810 [Camellia sinensis]|uniref:uncharacterized protein LOC114271810 n=1 Tax=Camellia sinensis TaxID=4442 RepID=UPI0010357258|nr:uncharacterized protein LOC114271810 [Camellia sinensis]
MDFTCELYMVGNILGIILKVGAGLIGFWLTLSGWNGIDTRYGGYQDFFSDHRPILLMEDDRNWGPKPFKFINAWVLHPKFLGDAKKVWDSTNVHGWACCIIMENLRTLKVALKKWNVEVFGDVESELKEAESVLHSMDLQSEVRELTEEEKARRKEVRGLLWKLSKRKEWMWMQKSRLDWALKRDRNTRFFHIMATKKHNRNMITSVLVNGVEVDEPIEVKHAACYHFQNLFTEHWWFRPSIGGDFKKIVANQIDAILEREFLEEEVWAAVK